jgi:hypothetical protein
MQQEGDGRQSIVVYLEGTLNQQELARHCVRRMPGIVQVTFSGHSRAIMYVFALEPDHGRGSPNGEP